MNDYDITIKPVRIGLRSRIIIAILRRVIRPMMAWMIRGSDMRFAKIQCRLSGVRCRNTHGLHLSYDVIGQTTAHVLGNIDSSRQTAILYLHGGAFILPAVPDTHVTMLAGWCKELNAVGIMPDYRLAPFNKFPHALDDCESAYRELLERGFDPARIIVAGESAGGNLLLGLLQRIRKAGLARPACAIPISPATEIGRIHGPPSRSQKSRSDALLPIAALSRIARIYAGDRDSADPELSPLYMTCENLPPIYFVVSDAEVLRDDTLMLYRRMRRAGADVSLDLWPILPHAFPLFSPILKEARGAQDDIIAFIRRHVS